VLGEDVGGSWGAANEPGGDQLRWVCRVQFGCSVPGGGGEACAVLCWGVLGGG